MIFKAFKIIGLLGDIALMWESKSWRAMVSPLHSLLKIVKPKKVDMPDKKFLLIADRIAKAMEDHVITETEAIEIFKSVGVKFNVGI